MDDNCKHQGAVVMQSVLFMGKKTVVLCLPVEQKMESIITSLFLSPSPAELVFYYCQVEIEDWVTPIIWQYSGSDSFSKILVSSKPLSLISHQEARFSAHSHDSKKLCSELIMKSYLLC